MIQKKNFSCYAKLEKMYLWHICDKSIKKGNSKICVSVKFYIQFVSSDYYFLLFNEAFHINQREKTFLADCFYIKGQMCFVNAFILGTRCNNFAIKAKIALFYWKNQSLKKVLIKLCIDYLQHNSRIKDSSI